MFGQLLLPPLLRSSPGWTGGFVSQAQICLQGCGSIQGSSLAFVETGEAMVAAPAMAYSAPSGFGIPQIGVVLPWRLFVPQIGWDILEGF